MSFFDFFTGAGKVEDAAERATAASRQHFEIAKRELDPFIEFGTEEGIDRISNLLENPDMLTRMPFFQFLERQGMRAVNRSAAATGMRGSGNHLLDLVQFGQGLASTQFGEHFGRLFGLAQLGQSSAGALAGASINTGNTIANTLANAGIASGQLHGSFMNELIKGGFNLKRPSITFGTT